MSHFVQKIKRIYYAFNYTEKLSSNHGLMIREWIAIAVICGSMLGLVIASKIPKEAQHYLRTVAKDQEEPLLDVSISGQVEKPGIYQVPPDTKVQDLMKLAKVTPEGNKRCKNSTSPLRQGQSVRVHKMQKKSKITHSSLAQN